MQQAGTSDLRGVGGAFPRGVSLQVLVLCAQLGKTQCFYFQPHGIWEKVACAERGAFFTCFSLCDCQEVEDVLAKSRWGLLLCLC